MPTWEYKLQEFTGSVDALREFLCRESAEDWQLGALFPSAWTGETDDLAEMLAAPVQHLYLMFKRQLPLMRSPTSSLKALL